MHANHSVLYRGTPCKPKSRVKNIPRHATRATSRAQLYIRSLFQPQACKPDKMSLGSLCALQTTGDEQVPVTDRLQLQALQACRVQLVLHFIWRECGQ